VDVTFFAKPATTTDARVDAALAAEASFQAEGAVGDEVTPAVKSRRAVWPFVVGGIALLGVTALLELNPAEAPKETPTPVVVAAPSAPKVEVAPVAAAAPVEEPAPPAVDVSENLALGSQLYERGEYKKAITVLEQVVADAPESVNGWLQLGLARYDSGDSKGAREAAEKVLALAPANGRVQLLLATLYFDQGDREQGRAAIQKYLELEPNGAHVAEAKALLR
jgi:Tfp pilus assembly protein PilF